MSMDDDSSASGRRLAFRRIESCADFARFLAELKEDVIESREHWENRTLEDYFDSMASWTETMCELQGSPVDQSWADAWSEIGHVPPFVPNDVPWHFIARLLSAPKIWE